VVAEPVSCGGLCEVTRYCDTQAGVLNAGLLNLQGTSQYNGVVVGVNGEKRGMVWERGEMRVGLGAHACAVQLFLQCCS
jgi:hypothetical protein